MTTTVDNEHTFYCDDCGTICAIAGSDAAKADPSLPVAAAERGSDRHICDVCVGNLQLARMNVGESEVVYISADGRSFRTWGGTKLGTVHELGGVGGIYSQESISRFLMRKCFKVVHWSGVTNDGVLVYGKTQGRSMCATAHPRRIKGRLQVEAGSPMALEAARGGAS